MHSIFNNVVIWNNTVQDKLVENIVISQIKKYETN